MFVDLEKSDTNADHENREQQCDEQGGTEEEEEDSIDVIVVDDADAELIRDKPAKQTIIVLPDEVDQNGTKDEKTADKPSSDNSKCKRCSDKEAKTHKALARAGLSSHMRYEERVERIKLIKRVNEVVKSSKECLKSTEQMEGVHTKYRDMAREIDLARQAILEYQLEVELACKAKLDALDKAEKTRKDDYNSFKDTVDVHSENLTKRLEEYSETWQRLKVHAAEKNFEAIDMDDLTSALELARHLEALRFDEPSVPKSEWPLQPGDSVRLSFSNDFIWIKELLKTDITHDSVGIIHSVRSSGISKMYTVNFNGMLNWTVNADKLTRSYKKSYLPKVGDIVRLKSPTNNPINVKKMEDGNRRGGKRIKIDSYVTYAGRTGVLSEIANVVPGGGDYKVFVDYRFNDRKYETFYSSIEKVPGCGFKEWDSVRICSKIRQPLQGWLGVHPSSEGTIESMKNIDGSDIIFVSWQHCNSCGWCPECRSKKLWKGRPGELERVLHPKISDQVQVRLDIDKPVLDWAGITYRDVGKLVKIQETDVDSKRSMKLGFVKFPQRTVLWPCVYEELEKARFQCSDDEDDSDISLEGDSRYDDDVILEESYWSDDSW